MTVSISLRRVFLCASAFLLPGIAFIICSQPGTSQTGPLRGSARQTPSTEFECRFTDTPIKITGKGTDPAWKRAQVIDNFYLPWLGDKARAAKTKTRAKLLWDREHLYFFADMDDTDLYADVKEHDGMTWDNDVFELFFKPADDKPGYYEFQVNAAGTVMDMFLPRRGAGGYKRFIKDGAFHIDVKVNLRGTLNKWTDRDEGWSVEGKIPWTDFLRTGGRPAVGEQWKFALCRYDYSVDFEGPELSTNAPLKGKGFPDFHHFEDYATLRFVGPAKAGALLPHGIEQWTPVTTSRVVGSPDAPNPYRIKRVFPDLKITYPIALVHQPGSDRLVVVQQQSPGGQSQIVRFKDDPRVAELETLLTFDGTAYGIEFHPNFRKNGYFYIGAKGPAGGPSADKRAQVVRYTMDTKAPFKVDPKSAQVIIAWQSDGHDGLGMGFGHDGMFYLTTGDGTSDSDTNVVGQDMTTLLAKVLRIDLEHPEAGKQYGVPRDNPFVGLKGARPEIWALGVRNPWRLTVDQKTGHVWVGQNGQDLYEQAFLVKKGDNYGWSVNEGSHPFYPTRKKGPNFITPPTIEHSHSEFRSLTGGIVYYGTKHPELRGAYIYGDYSTGTIWGMKHDGAKPVWHKKLADTSLAIAGFGADSRGELLIVDYRGGDKGGFYTFEATPRDLPASIFPKKLSDSGLFKSVKGHVMQDGMIPYSVNAVLWSDGAAKRRWLHVPPGGKIDFTTNRGWNFPDLTTIVKSFYLDMEEGNAASRKWIETRFLTKQDGEWHGYSYAWNDEQTEATLVEARGTDREYTITANPSAQPASAKRKLSWHYPSRAECMVCHSRAANYVLGLTEVQFNKVHDYNGVKDNQLRVLESLGLLKVNYWEETRSRLREDAKAKGMSESEANKLVEQATATRDQRGPVTTTSMLSFDPDRYRKLVDPYDKQQDISLRARSYLHSNCAQCHVEAGGGNAQMELEFTTPLDKTRLIGVKPVHDTFGLKNAALVVPGHPERSLLLKRLANRDKGQMPPLATRIVDRQAVELMTEWISQLNAENKLPQLPKKTTAP
jgi:glucose/arabinose dehydrogenase/mono/diheme cytochrome c family protein